MADFKDHKKMFNNLRKRGWTVDYTRKGHIKLKPPQSVLDSHPEAPPYVIAALSPSDFRGHRNLLARIKRSYGITL
jgi:hypothetical protein